MKVHRDILAGLLACTTTKRGMNPVYANIGVSRDGKKLYAADSTILAVGDCEGFEGAAGMVLSGTDLAQVMTDMKGLRFLYIEFGLSWDERDGLALLQSISALPIRILTTQIFPDPTGLIEGHPFYGDPDDRDGAFAVASSQLNRVAKVMKPLHTAFILPGNNRSTSWWAIGRALTTEKPAPELRLLAMPVHTSEWPE